MKAKGEEDNPEVRCLPEETVLRPTFPPASLKEDQFCEMDHSVLRCTRKYYCVGWPYLLIAPRVPALQVPGGRDFVYPKYPKQLDRARRNLKPTSSPISKCGRSRLNPFLDACHAIALQRTCSAQPAIRWLVGWSTLRPRLTRAGPPRLALTPRTRRMQRCGRPSKTPATSAASACSA